MHIRNVLHSGNVVRFHNHVGIDKQKNSEHQWGVALIVQHIHPDCSKSLLLAALTHDCAEYLTGDIPFPVKQANPELKSMLEKMETVWEVENGVHFNLTPDEKITLKMGDTLEGLKFCLLQVKMGNQMAGRPFRKWSKFYNDNLSNQNHAADMLFVSIVTEMEEL